MKKIFLWIIIFFMLFPVAGLANLSDGCTAYYSFNGDWVDGSPMEISAKPSGDPIFDDGIKGQAVYLDGIDDYLSMGVNNFIDQLTISFWIKFPQLKETWQPLISIYDETTVDGITQLKHTLFIKVLGKSNAHKIYLAVTENGQQSSDIVSKTTITPQTWYHIVAMFQESVLILYINGQKENEKQTPFQQLYTSSIPTLVGAMFNNGVPKEPFAHVIMDELRLYNRNLSSSEITMLYEKQSGSQIIEHQPRGILERRISYIDIFFDHPIISQLFTSDDIIMTDPDEQIISVNEPVQLSNTAYRLAFPEQSANGTYTLEIGPQIIDHAGNPLNQDQDSINGELEEDVYVANFQLTVLPDNVILINFSNTYNDLDGLNLYNTLLETGATAIYVNLLSENNEETLISLLSNTNNTYQQIWVFDISDMNGYYPKAVSAISEWYLNKNGRHIICDGRIRASYWAGQWKTKGQALTRNYYDNLKLNGGGLLLATDHPDAQPDINQICEQIHISPFGDVAGYNIIQTDMSCQTMTYPNELGETMGTTSSSSLVPTGKQTNGMFLYCVAWDQDNSNNCSISTTLLPLIPTAIASEVYGNSIRLKWKPASPEEKVSYYNVYSELLPFQYINDLAPVEYGITETNATISSLEYKKTYYMAVTAVDISGNERQEVLTISATTESNKRSSGGDGGGGCFLNVLKY